ncbi:PRD domain-containing protein [Streptomyces sp. NPDC057638]|uniref:PRD domain-containing protein n=1 Tax=Streptomyces sp. NPDC057638 TaxID=3346190 RepID=UPI0036D1DE89
MDEGLALRIRVFRDSARVRADVADFVTAELERLAAGGRTVTEDTAGILTSHLMMALTRLVKGETLDGSPADAHLAAELAEHPEAVHAARELAARARDGLGAAFPTTEIAFLALHLAALARPSPTGTVPDVRRADGGPKGRPGPEEPGERPSLTGEPREWRGRDEDPP